MFSFLRPPKVVTEMARLSPTLASDVMEGGNGMATDPSPAQS